MLVIVSDLHLSDGSSGSTLPPGACEVFADRLSDLAQRASWRSDGRYQPIDRIDLVLLGDILDITRSTRWLQSSVRPWDNAQTPEMVETISGIVDDVLWRNGPGLASLRSLASESAVRVASSDPTVGATLPSPEHAVPVRTHYMVGNHDWQLHLPGANYDLIRQKVAHHLGLANTHNAPFPHDASESDELLDALRRHRVIARHGDIYDPINFAEDRDTSSLGDAIVIELALRFVVDAENELGDDLPDDLLAGLRQLDNIRPVLLAPVWLDGLLERSTISPAVRNRMKRLWDQLADNLLQMDIVRQRDSCCPFDLVDGLEAALKFSKRLSSGWAGKISTWLQSLRGANDDSYYQHALTEPDFRNRRARHIVYGHTHQAESVPLDASYADSFVLEQMYFNTGTWRRVYRPAHCAPGQQEFIPAECMNLLAFYQGDERQGRLFESWSGTLGVVGCETAVTRRVDVAPETQPQQPVGTSSATVGPPHFIHPAAASARVTSVRRI